MLQVVSNREVRQWNYWSRKTPPKLRCIAKKSTHITKPAEISINPLPKKPSRKLPGPINTNTLPCFLTRAGTKAWLVLWHQGLSKATTGLPLFLPNQTDMPPAQPGQSPDSTYIRPFLNVHPFSKVLADTCMPPASP